MSISLERGTVAWDKAWAQVSEACAACGMSPDLDAGEGWQYMGSDDDHFKAHTFRNRLIRTHVGDRRVYVHLPLDGGTTRVIIQPEPGRIENPQPWAARGAGFPIDKEVAARHAVRRPVEGVDWVCTGNYDGFGCGSDADSGL